MSDSQNNTLTALKGVKVGHSTHTNELTGCTVVLFDDAFPVAYKSTGGAPGTFATENLNSGKEFGRRDCLFVAGGSLNGLNSASTISRELIKQRRGLKVGSTVMPAISGAIVYDLGMGTTQYDPEYGAEALASVSSDKVNGGNVGAGTGTAVGKFHWLQTGEKNGGMKAGVGSAKVELGNLTVCALSVVNALGNVVLPNGKILAGNRSEQNGFIKFEQTAEFVTKPNSNTTISIIGINLDLNSKENYEKVASMAGQGQVRAIDPVSTSVDGDTVFVFSNLEHKTLLNKNGKFWETPNWPNFSVDVVGSAAAKAVQESIYDACRQAETIQLAEGYEGIIPSTNDHPTHQ